MRNLVVATLSLSLCAAALASTAEKRASTVQKGSLLILPKVELRWTDNPNPGDPNPFVLAQDTFVTLSNDRFSNVTVKIYYLNGDEMAAAGDLGPNERAHTGCNAIDMALNLTGEEPYYWSLFQPTESTTLNQLPRSFTQVDFDSTGGQQPGRPDPLGSTDRVLRGAVIMYATNTQLQPVRHNHLSAKATVVNYAAGTAYEYNAWAFQNTSVSDGTPIPFPPSGALQIGAGANPYDYAPGQLLLDFFADGSNALGGEVTTELTLLPLNLNLTLADEPTVTLVSFVVHNQNEVPFTWSQNYCLECWLSTYLGNIRPDVFLVSSLQTNRGKARIDGVASAWCMGNNKKTGALYPSQDTALLGVATKIIDFGGDVAYAASPLVGQLDESADIIVNPATDPGGELKPGIPVGTGANPTVLNLRR